MGKIQKRFIVFRIERISKLNDQKLFRELFRSIDRKAADDFLDRWIKNPRFHEASDEYTILEVYHGDPGGLGYV